MSNRQSAQMYRVQKVTAKVIMEVVEGCSQSKGLRIKGAAEYAGISNEYARRAVDIAVQFGMLNESEGKYSPVADMESVAKANDEQKGLIFRKYLQRYEPFIIFISLVSKRNSIEVAARKVGAIYEINNGKDNIEGMFMEWGRYAGIIEVSDDNVSLKVPSLGLPGESMRNLLQAMQDDVSARLYVSNKLGTDIFGYLKHDEIELLVSAIAKHESDPRTAIANAGQALEDVLRRIGTDKGIDMTPCKGIQELADRLKGDKKIDQKHLEICKGLNVIRIATAHNKDRMTITPWKVYADTAIEFVQSCLTAIRSIHNYVFNNAQII